MPLALKLLTLLQEVQTFFSQEQQFSKIDEGREYYASVKLNKYIPGTAEGAFIRVTFDFDDFELMQSSSLLSDVIAIYGESMNGLKYVQVTEDSICFQVDRQFTVNKATTEFLNVIPLRAIRNNTNVKVRMEILSNYL